MYNYEEELYHFGIPKMKWGVRRYQNEDGSRTEEGKRHYGYKGYTNDSDDAPPSKRQIRIQRREAKKAAKAEKKRLKFEKEKERILREGSANEIMKYSKNLTVDEKRAAAARLEADSKLIAMANAELERKARLAQQNSKWNKVKKVANAVGDAGAMIEKLTKTYNASAKIINSFGDTQWPIVGEKASRKTRSMELAEQLTQEYGDYSYKEWGDMSKENIEKLDTLNQRIAKLAAAEKLAGKKKG